MKRITVTLATAALLCVLIAAPARSDQNGTDLTRVIVNTTKAQRYITLTTYSGSTGKIVAKFDSKKKRVSIRSFKTNYRMISVGKRFYSYRKRGKCWIRAYNGSYETFFKTHVEDSGLVLFKITLDVIGTAVDDPNVYLTQTAANTVSAFVDKPSGSMTFDVSNRALQVADDYNAQTSTFSYKKWKLPKVKKRC